MKTFLLYFAAFVAVCVTLCSCDHPESDFKKAVQTNTEQAYQEFVKEHPDSPLVAQAKALIEKNAYEEAKRTATPAAYDAFLKRFQSGELVQQAKGDMEAIELSQAVKAGTIPIWQAFLHKYPLSTNAAMANHSLAQLEYDAAVKANDIASFEGFLTNHPDSELAKDIKSRLQDQLEEHDWNEALLQNNRHSYENFVKKHPDNQRLRIAAGTMQGTLKMTGAGVNGIDKIFRISASADANFPVLDLNDFDALKLGFIPVGPDGDYTEDFQISYIYNAAEAIAIKQASGEYRLVHFSCSGITTGQSSGDSGGLTISGGAHGHLREGVVVGPPTLPP